MSDIRGCLPVRDPAYRLTLDNPGQISGLDMKTYRARIPWDQDDVEIEVAAAALNFPRRHGHVGFVACPGL